MKKREVERRLQRIAQLQYQPTLEDQIVSLNTALQFALLDFPRAMQDFADAVRQFHLAVVETLRLPPKDVMLK